MQPLLKNKFSSAISLIYVLISAHAEAAPRALSDLNLLRLFHAFPAAGTLVNRLPSSTKTLPPYLQFTQNLPLNHGVANLPGACSLRTVSASKGHSSYFNQILETLPAQVLSRNSIYTFQGLHSRDQTFSAIFKSDKEPQLIEISCAHPELKDWTVSHFESELSGKAELRVYPESNPKKRIMPPFSVSMINVKSFNGSWANGLFGSGLPGTVGIQLMMGTNLKAFREPAGASIVRGRRCTLIAQESASLDSSYKKDSRFGFLGPIVKAEENLVELVFDNWNYSPHQIRVQCSGSKAEVLAMNSREIERDLNGAVHFYQK